MNNRNIVLKAMQFASNAHGDQKDDSENPYIFHLIQVANLVSLVASDDSNLIAAAYLHDVLEDTETTYTELLDEFGFDIAQLVLQVTHEGKKDSTGYFFPRLESKRAIILKFADRLSNLSRMDCWDEKRQDQYVKRSKFWKDQPLVPISECCSGRTMVCGNVTKYYVCADCLEPCNFKFPQL